MTNLTRNVMASIAVFGALGVTTQASGYFVRYVDVDPVACVGCAPCEECVTYVEEPYRQGTIVTTRPYSTYSYGTYYARPRRRSRRGFISAGFGGRRGGGFYFNW